MVLPDSVSGLEIASSLFVSMSRTLRVSSTWVIPLVLLSENFDAAAEQVLHVKSGVHEWMLHRPLHFR